jgi:hypothetical protein
MCNTRLSDLRFSAYVMVVQKVHEESCMTLMILGIRKIRKASLLVKIEQMAAMATKYQSQYACQVTTKYLMRKTGQGVYTRKPNK